MISCIWFEIKEVAKDFGRGVICPLADGGLPVHPKDLPKLINYKGTKIGKDKEACLQWWQKFSPVIMESRFDDLEKLISEQWLSVWQSGVTVLTEMATAAADWFANKRVKWSWGKDLQLIDWQNPKGC